MLTSTRERIGTAFLFLVGLVCFVAIWAGVYYEHKHRQLPIFYFFDRVTNKCVVVQPPVRVENIECTAIPEGSKIEVVGRE